MDAYCSIVVGFMLICIGCGLGSGLDLVFATHWILLCLGFCGVVWSLHEQNIVGPSRSRYVMMIGAWILVWACWLFDTLLFGALLGLGLSVVLYGWMIRPELRV